MQYAVTILILLASLVNLAPVTGLISAARLESLYGIPFADPDLVVLMRHRAVLFGIVGGLLLVSAFHPPLRPAATVSGLVSMLSFVVIVFFAAEANEALKRIAWIDVGATVALVAAWLMDRAPAA